MPEIAEVARVVHFLRKSLVGKTLKTVTAPDDVNVFGKVGTTGPAFEKALTGKKVLDAGQQGKYFWLIMSSPPHPVFHLGMTGWMYIRGEPSIHYRPKGPQEAEVWPPRFWKFTVKTDEPEVEAAFTDARRFARIRLVDCAAKDIRNTTPLKENGPDPVIDRDILTEEWLEKKMKSKHVPVKALLLDQANISGVGNWVGDEVMYHAKLHPEQYSDTFSAEQLKRLHTSLLYVCKTAVDLLADSSKFPNEWLFNHRWGKGKKDAATTLPNGARITFLTVGGRTSCVVPSVQKKTGAVAGDVKRVDKTEISNEEVTEGTEKANRSKKRKTDAVKDEESTEGQLKPAPKSTRRKPKSEPDNPTDDPPVKKRKAVSKSSTQAQTQKEEAASSRRRSGRLLKG